MNNRLNNNSRTLHTIQNKIPNKIPNKIHNKIINHNNNIMVDRDIKLVEIELNYYNKIKIKNINILY